MVNVHPPRATTDCPDADRARFRVLLTEDRTHSSAHWSRQLPRLMQPLGVEAIIAAHAQQALDALDDGPLDAAVVDLATPRAPGKPSPADDPGGLYLLNALARHRRKPPVIVVDSRVVTPAQVHRALQQALRLGAFSVLRRPVELEQLLVAIQRLIDRHFQGHWPGGQPSPSNFQPPFNQEQQQ
ncbi:MAG: hypothetical protein AAFY08_08695 [Planctomycetota bacterium]